MATTLSEQKKSCTMSPRTDHPRYILILISLATHWFPGLTIVIGIVLAIVESPLLMPWLFFGTMTTVVATFLIVASRILCVQKTDR